MRCSSCKLLLLAGFATMVGQRQDQPAIMLRITALGSCVSLCLGNEENPGMGILVAISEIGFLLFEQVVSRVHLKLSERQQLVCALCSLFSGGGSNSVLCVLCFQAVTAEEKYICIQNMILLSLGFYLQF
jgi:hypothetical protein